MKNKIEFDVQPVERAYGAVYNRGSNGHPRVMLTYSRFAEGCFLAMSPREKEQLIPDYQQYLRERYEKEEVELGPRKRRLLTCKPEELKAHMLARIVAETGTKKLWTAGPKGIEGYVGHEVMTGRVPSRRSGRKSGILAKWPVVERTPVYMPGAGIVLTVMKCGCDDNDWDTTKGASVVCFHGAAETKRAYDEQANPAMPDSERRIIFDGTKGPIFLPFIIPPVKAMDVVFRKYALYEPMIEIDRKEMEVEENYDPLLLQAIETGLFVFEGIRQWFTRVPYSSGAEKKAVEAKLGIMRSFRDDYLAHQFKKTGFKKADGYALELKGTQLETLCETYERDGEVIRPVLRSDAPPLLVRRTLGNEKQLFYTPDKTHPFLAPFGVHEGVDDRTRRKGTKQVIIPGHKMPEGFDPVYIHPLFREEYRKLIMENNPDDVASQLLRQLGLAS